MRTRRAGMCSKEEEVRGDNLRNPLVSSRNRNSLGFKGTEKGKEKAVEEHQSQGRGRGQSLSRSRRSEIGWMYIEEL